MFPPFGAAPAPEWICQGGNIFGGEKFSQGDLPSGDFKGGCPLSGAKDVKGQNLEPAGESRGGIFFLGGRFSHGYGTVDRNVAGGKCSGETLPIARGKVFIVSHTEGAKWRTSSPGVQVGALPLGRFARGM